MALTGQDKRIIIGLFVIISSVYFATITGVTSSNDGSHYALVRALVDGRSFEISPYMDFTEHQDYALNGDRRYSDRPPGTAILAAPLYALSAIAPNPPILLPSRHDGENPRMVYAVIAASLMMSATLILFYMTLRQHFEIRIPSAALTTLALAFGTTMWKYGSVLYSHAAAGLILWIALYLILTAESHGCLDWKQVGLLGFAFGFAPLTEYTHLPLVFILGGYLLAVFLAGKIHAPDFPERWGLIAAFIIGGIVPAGFLAFYNLGNFGGIFELSTFNVDTTIWPQNENLAADFATPILVGLKALLFYGDNNQGVFLLSPVALLALLGLPLFYKKSLTHFFLLMGIFLGYLLLFSKSTTFNPLTNDGRYLTPFIALLFVPIAFWLDSILSKRDDSLRSLALLGLVFGLIFLSMRNQFIHIAFSWNYLLDLTQLRPLSTPPENIALLFGTVFPNTPNLPILWGGEGAVGLVLLLWNRRKSQQKS